MSGGGKTTFLRQLEQLAEVTSASPIKVWNRPHALHDTDAGILHTPPRIRLFPPFPTHGKLSKSNEVEHLPVEPSKIESIQPCAEVSPSPGKEISFVLDCILAKLAKKEVEESPDQFSKANLMLPCEEVLSHPARKRSPSPLSMEDNLTKVPKMEKSRGNNSNTFSEQQSDGANDSDDADSGFYTQ